MRLDRIASTAATTRGSPFPVPVLREAPTDRQAERQTAFFQRMDTDKDGFVSKAEFMAQADRNFTRCDLDKDGRINTAECRQALRRPSSTPVSNDR